MSASDISSYFELPTFVVVGASKDRAKFGNQVFRCYQSHNKQVFPIHPSEPCIENVPCHTSLSDAKSFVVPAKTGVSIITPPAATLKVLQEGLTQGYTHFFLQPGTYDHAVDAWIDGHREQANVIKSCVLVQLGCE
jgi:predicted CoA-binding protein